MPGNLRHYHRYQRYPVYPVGAPRRSGAWRRRRPSPLPAGWRGWVISHLLGALGDPRYRRR